MAPSATTPCSGPTPKSSEASRATTGELKTSHNFPIAGLCQLGGANSSGSMLRETAAGDCSNPCPPGPGRAPAGSTRQDPHKATIPVGTPAKHHGPTRHEPQWDEGTVYGRLASLNCQPTDRDAVYRDKATQAISDFEERFR